MQPSKKKVNQNLRKQIHRLLYQAIVDIRSQKEAKEFLQGLLTESEREMMAKRLGVAYFLDKGRSYAYIKNNLGISSATISNIVEQMKTQKGLQATLKKINAEEWAQKWSRRLSQIISRR